MKNVFLQTEIKNMELFAENFLQRCQAATIKDDGRIDPEEAKAMRKIHSATEKFLKQLSKIP